MNNLPTELTITMEGEFVWVYVHASIKSQASCGICPQDSYIIDLKNLVLDNCVLEKCLFIWIWFMTCYICFVHISPIISKPQHTTIHYFLDIAEIVVITSGLGMIWEK